MMISSSKPPQAEWFRIRAHRNLESHLASTHGFSPFNWTPDQIKKHDLLLRYKTTAERSLQHEFRMLEQFCKFHQSQRPRSGSPEHRRRRNPAHDAVLPSG